MMGEREKPKVQGQKRGMLALISGIFTPSTAALLKALDSLKGGHRSPVFRERQIKNTPAKHPSRFFAEKRDGKHGGFKDWELSKIWRPHFRPDGSIFVAQSSDSRQQRRARIRSEAYAYMKEKFGGESRRQRRLLARAKMKNFIKIERKMALDTARVSE